MVFNEKHWSPLTINSHQLENCNSERSRITIKASSNSCLQLVKGKRDTNKVVYSVEICCFFLFFASKLQTDQAGRACLILRHEKEKTDWEKVRAEESGESSWPYKVKPHFLASSLPRGLSHTEGKASHHTFFFILECVCVSGHICFHPGLHVVLLNLVLPFRSTSNGRHAFINRGWWEIVTDSG